MKAMRNQRTSTKTVAFAALLSIGSALAGVPSAHAAEPNESGGGKVCGVLRVFQGDLQVFDSSRTHLGEASFGTKLRCGDWVAIETGRATIEHVGGASLLVSENTFFQILDPQSGVNPEHAQIALYRGEFMVQSGEKSPVVVVTPNAIARVEKGGAFVVFSSSAEESQIVGLGGKASLENRFFGEKKATAGFAQFVAFANPVERIVPEEPRWVNARDLNARLTKIGVEIALRDAIEKAVKGGAKTRMPTTLASTRASDPAGRGEFVAAVGAPLPEHLRGHAPAAGVTRAPASTPVSDIATPGPTRPKKTPVRRIARQAEREPDFALKRPISEAQERQKLIQALSGIRPEDEE